MSASYEILDNRRRCTQHGCVKSFAIGVSTNTWRKHTATHQNQISLLACVSTPNNSSMNEKLASILARLKLPLMTVEGYEFRTELVELFRTTTRACPYRQAITNNTHKVALPFLDRIITRLVEWNEPVTVASHGKMYFNRCA